MQIRKIIQIANEIKDTKGIVYIIGNGGAASHADHFACDLLKNADVKALSLCCNNAIITAISNDLSFDDIFVCQLKTLFDFNKDILIAMSTSGKSENVIRAAKYVSDSGGLVIAITKDKQCSLVVRSIPDITLELNGIDTQCLEDKITKTCHAIFKTVQDGV